MQIQKDDIRREILTASRREFEEHGFTGANIRRIAKEVGISVGNIYNYFKNKDDVFHELVKPTVEAVKEARSWYDSMDVFSDDHLWGLEFHYTFTDQIAEFLDTHRSNLKLLLFSSHKSRYENFKEEFIDWHTETQKLFNEKIRERFPDAVKDLSDFFVHTLSSFYVNVPVEMLMHDLSKDEMSKGLREVMYFLFYGWDGVIDISQIFPGKTRF